MSAATVPDAAAEVADDDPAAIALPAPDDDEDLEDAEYDVDLDDDDEDTGEDEGEDAAAVAGRWRADAAAARERAAQVAAEAQEKIRQAEQEARSERQRLEAEAAEADEQAAHWQAIADRGAVIAACEREAEGLSARLSALRAEEATLTAEADQLGARLAEFGAAREQAAQRLRDAPSITDVGESVAAVKDAMADLSAVEQAEAPSAARLQQVRARLAEVRGNEVQRGPSGNWRGPATGMPAVNEDLARLGERLRILRREHAGLPPVGQAAQIAMRVIADAPVPEGTPEDKAGMARVLALGRVTDDMERLAQESPDEYAQLRDHYLRGKPPVPEQQSAAGLDALAEALTGRAGPGLTALPDGTYRYERTPTIGREGILGGR